MARSIENCMKYTTNRENTKNSFLNIKTRSFFQCIQFCNSTIITQFQLSSHKIRSFDKIILKVWNTCIFLTIFYTKNSQKFRGWIFLHKIVRIKEKLNRCNFIHQNLLFDFLGTFYNIFFGFLKFLVLRKVFRSNLLPVLI